MNETKWLTQVKRGLLELCILNLVSQDEMYGYQVVQRLTEVPGLVITVGTIYPLLSRLKREGLLTSVLVESDRGPARRMYSLTSDGRHYLHAINESWKEIAGAVEKLLTPGSDQR